MTFMTARMKPTTWARIILMASVYHEGAKKKGL